MNSSEVNRLIREKTGLARDDFDTDLNAMREAILALDSIQVVLWAGELYGIARSNHEDKEVALLMSSAAQQAEAFCRVFWPEKFK